MGWSSRFSQPMIEICQQFGVSVIIPAHNEEEGVGIVVGAARAVPEVDEVLVIDDGSQDDTASVATDAGAEVVSHTSNRGKGRAMQTGCEAAECDIFIFLDADLKNITPQKIRKILRPFAENYDYVKTRFDRRGGRVTHLTAMPLLGRFFPDIADQFEQPLSGQIGIKKFLMEKLTLEDDLGVDIGILIDVMQMSPRAKEVYYGWLEHDQKKLRDLDKMASAVSRVILDRALTYGLIHRAAGDQVLEAE